MKFRVVGSQIDLGELVHEWTDEGMGVVGGAFRPFAGYREVQPLFRRLSGMMDRGVDVPQEVWAERDRLALALQASDGTRIDAEWVMIHDFGEELDLTMEAGIRSREQLIEHFVDSDKTA